MDKPWIGVHIWMILLVQVALWTVPNVAGVNPGGFCTSTEQCVNNAVCRFTFPFFILTCQCDSGSYQDGQQCLTRKSPGDSCASTDQCVTNAVCTGSSSKTCECGSGFYQDGQRCLTRKSPGSSCTSVGQCVDNAECTGSSSKTCQCNSDYYPNGLQCSARKNPGDGCTSVGQCVVNAECTGSSSKTCQCNSDYYQNGQQCSARKTPGSSCTLTDQCVENAECTGSSSSKTCQCNSDYYQNGLQCSARIPVGESCTGSSGSQGNCVTGALCEAGTCKHRVKDACSSSGTDYCQTGSQCVYVGVNKYECRITAGSDLNCNSDSSQCVLSAICEATQCKTLLNQPCTGTSPDNCQTATVCVDVSGGRKQCRRTYDSTCSAGSQCQTSNHQDCLSYDSSSSQKCLCSAGYFRQKTTNICLNVYNLGVKNLRQNDPIMETSIISAWAAPVALNGADAEYRASLTGPPLSWSTWSTNYFANFPGLTPGKQYTVSVSTRTRKDLDYEQEKVEYTTGNRAMYTKPGMPGALVPGSYAVPSVTLKFNPSDGLVGYYIVTVMGEEKLVSGQVSPLAATFTIENPGTNYQVTIVARSYGIKSDVRTETFSVDAAIAGKVSALSVPEHGGRWSKVTWRKPSAPNGDIKGYTVQLTTTDGNKMVCKSGVTVLCSDCTNSDSNVPSVTDCATQSSVSQTSSELEYHSYLIQVNVTDLQPDVTYKVRVNAYNQKGMGANEDKTVTTNQEAALTLQEVNLATPANNAIQVTWIPGERTGPTTYTVTWREKETLTSNSFVPKDSINIEGYDNQDYSIPGLLSYWTYEVSVLPFTPVADPPAGVMTKTTITNPTAPAAVVGLLITQPYDSALKVMLSAQCPEEKQRNGPIMYISYTATVSKQGVYNKNAPAENISVTSKDCEVALTEIDVDPEASYNFSVFAKTPSHDGEPTQTAVTINSRPPTLEKPADGSDLVDSSSSTTTNVTLNLSPSLFSSDQGSVEVAGLIVCFKSSTENCQSASGTQTQDKYNTLPSWTKFKSNGFKGRYRPTPPDFMKGTSRRRRSVSGRVARDVTNAIQYTVGDETCGQNSTSYCNGPLPEGTEFVVILWVCTSAGCTEADGVTVKTLSQEDDIPIGAIVGAVAAVLVITVIVAVAAVIILRRRRSKPLPHAPVPMTNTRKPSKTSVRKCVKLTDFAAHLERLHMESDLLFQEEYDDIRDRSPQLKQEAASLETNRMKNRFVDVLPYDDTRVKLSIRGDDDTSDFINASYIAGYTSDREYIATQYPVIGTVSDFWRMVWEQRSSLIVQLSDLREKESRTTLDIYWPMEKRCPVQYDGIVVEMTATFTQNKYTIRTFRVHKEDRKKDVRRVAQYFIPGWEDNSSLNPDDMLDFIGATRQKARCSQGPIIVHCSAGVGRTGTFIALDYLMQFVQEHSLEDEVDIYNLVLNMRYYRPLLVQTMKQYIFIHDMLKVMVDRKIQATHVYKNTTSPQNIYEIPSSDAVEHVYEEML